MILMDHGTPHAPCPAPYLGGPSLVNVCNADSASLFLTMLNTLVAYSPVISDPCHRLRPIRQPASSYDFIVIGAGAAGSVVAARLSEITNWNVLLLEAGPDEPAGSEIPSNLQLYLNTELDWKYKTTNESFACLKQNGSCSWPRGKNLGGCTIHHGMAYHRGHAQDFEKWTEMGNQGWSWQEVLPYFFKSEDNREIGRVDAKYHGVGGPMTVERFPWQPQFAWDVIAAAEEVGFGVTEDMVGENVTGFTVAQTISRNGVRLSAPRAFLWPHRNRRNLHVAVNATATKINTREKNGKVIADGVTFVMNGRQYKIKARKEVVISAGAINSPQLLLLSGIGPRNHLESLEIPVANNLPGVGENLHNHVSYGIHFTLNQTKSNLLNNDTAQVYLYNQTGPLSATGLAQLTGLLLSNYTTHDYPDIQIFFAGYQAICNTGGRISDLEAYDNNETVRFTSVNVQTRSRGRITLASKDPSKQPIIWSNDLADPQDRSIIYQGIEHIIKLSQSKTLQKYGLKMVMETVPECKQYESSGTLSYEYWDCQFRYNTRPENHQAGTCKMGPSSDPLAVVDSTLKVHGVDRLRVADASIMPRVVSGNPVAAVNMIGERAADFIKQYYNVIRN